jgi:hypothetical protein
MHDGILIIHENSLNLSYLEEYINKNLETYSEACIGLVLKVSVINLIKHNIGITYFNCKIKKKGLKKT